MPQNVPFIAAIDIGYSAVKTVFGAQNSEPQKTTLPAGAGPVLHMAEGLNRRVSDFLTVQICGENWATGVEPSRLDGWARDLHADYPASEQYRALFYAALLVSEVDQIDQVITGLPVSQAHNPARVKALRDRLLGKHQITLKRQVEVNEVHVLPQPVGAWLDYLSSPEADAAALESARVLVLDSGFFSVDWVAIEDGELRNSLAGTSTAAMSAVIEEADRAISHEHGASVGRDKIERALRDGRKTVTVYGHVVALESYLEAAAKTTAAQALMALRQNLRSDTRPFDAVLLTGGGATTYTPAVQELFPKAKILRPAETVHANARGFWSWAQ